MKTLVVDCNFLCYQSWFAMGELKHHDNGTGVIFGFMSQLYNLAQHFDTNRFIFCWDSKSSKRRDKHPFYKIRDKSGEDMTDAFRQFKDIRRHVLTTLGFRNNFVLGGFEGDDIIASVVINHEPDDGDRKIMISSDGDLYQLLEHAHMYNPRNRKTMTRKGFMEKYDIPPRLWAHVKALAGCTSDTVPGIKGIGEGYALRYLRGHLSRGKAWESIESQEGKAIYERNLGLVMLPMEGTPVFNIREDILYLNNFVEICQEYGFKSFLEDKRDWRDRFNME